MIQFEADGEQKYSFMNPNSPESEIMFELMQDRDMKESVNFAKLAQEEMVKSGGRKDMGVLQANLAVLRLTYMPSVLLEVGFISTPAEERFLMSDEGRTVMAQCIYNAISRYKTMHTGRMSKLEKINVPIEQEEVESVETAQERDTLIKHSDAVAPVAADAAPVFKIQILTSKKNLIPGSTHFKGLESDSFKEGDVYKYTYGSTTDYKEILKLKRQIAEDFPDAFIVAFKDGVKMNTNEAINEWKKKQ